MFFLLGAINIGLSFAGFLFFSFWNSRSLFFWLLLFWLCLLRIRGRLDLGSSIIIFAGAVVLACAFIIGDRPLADSFCAGLGSCLPSSAFWLAVLTLFFRPSFADLWQTERRRCSWSRLRFWLCQRFTSWLDLLVLSLWFLLRDWASLFGSNSRRR